MRGSERACRVVVMFVASALTACSGSSGTIAGIQSPASPSASPTTTSTTVALARPFSVTRRDVVVEDKSRPTPADPERGLAALPTRTLPLMILTPDGPGPFPLLEFSHGLPSDGPGYDFFLEPLAAAGYVVVAPTFPLTSGGTVAQLGRIADVVNQPGDVYFAIDAVINMASDPNDPLHGRVDTAHLALAGHSLGAGTTVAAAFNSCCRQSRVTAAIVLSGGELPFPNGDYANRPPISLLLVHGGMDQSLPPENADKLFAAATGPTAYLLFPDGTHSGILHDDLGKLTQQAVIAGLDRWLRNDPTGLAQLPAAISASGTGTLQTRGL
jgi:dienelactone hydrolase